MKTKFKSKLLSILLVLVMVLALAPVSALTAFAAEQNEVVTHDIDQIRELLRQDGDVRIKLDADAEKNLTAYSDFENTKWDSQYVWTKLGSGNKTIDLNGHRLYVYDQSARSLGSLDWMDFRYIQGALLMEIPNGASLTVNDSNGGGKIWMDAEMPDKSEMEGSGLLMERNIFAVTGGNLTINGGEIHAGRSKEIYAQNARKYDKDYELIIDYTIADIDFYEHLYGYATWFLSGTAITAESGNVTINGGNIWGRGWDNWSMITRVPGAPNGADDYRTRCAALRVLGTATAHITSGSFYGRSDADAVQVSNPNNLTVDAGSFDVGTNSLLVIPGVESDGTADNINDIFFHDSVFEVHEGYVGSFGIPAESLDDGSDAFISADGKTMTIAPIGSQTLPYKTIGDIGLYMNSPLAYKSPVDNANDIYGVPSDCEVESITWYENGHILENASSTYFKEGDSYYVKIALVADEYAKFNYNLTDATINGKTAEIYRTDDRHIVLTVHFGDCIAAVENVAFYAEEPLSGNYPSKWIDTNENNPYYAVGGYSNYDEYRTWYVSDDGVNGWTEMDGKTPFEAGKFYRLTFEIHAGEGQEFAVDASGVSVMPDITATVNGVTATVQKVYEQDPTQHIAVEIDFGKCPAVVQFVELTVTAPKEGETISYTVGSAQDTYYAIGDNSNYTDYRAWYESDTGYDNWRLMSPGETFKAGKYYKFITDIHTKIGYVFSTYDDGISIQPNVGAYVNDNGANVTKGYEQDPSNYITVEYFFGICYDTVVEKIDVENVVSPVAGKTPTYTVSIRGNGYLLEGTTSGNWMVNGIVWLRDGDNYTGSIMDKTDTFLPGHTYTVMIDFVPAMGYSFLFDHGNSIYAAASINGNTAQINLETCSANQYTIWYTFTCGAKTVDKVAITDLENPVGGNTPDTTVTVGDSDSYTVESVEWFDIEDNPVGATFEADVPYYALITLTPATGAVFADAETIEVTVNGSELGSVEIKNGKLLVYVIIRKPASAPIVNPYAFTTQPTGGTASVGETLTAYWQTTFIPTQTEIQYWDGEAWDQWDIQQAQSAVDSYDFVNADVASYRFRIVTYIGSDVVATSDEFVITWEEATKYSYVYTAGEGNGSNDSGYVTEGTQITLSTPESMGFTPIDGFTFDYWSIRTGENAMNSTEIAQKQPGETIIINDNTYIIAIWKEVPASTYTVAYGVGEGSGSADYETDIAFGSNFTLKAFGEVGIIAPNEKMFDYWSIRTGESAMNSTEIAQKQPGETIIINDNTYIIAMWKAIPHTCVGVAESGQGATCTVDGWKDYYRCECGKYYEDADCETLIPDLEAWKVGDGKITASHSGTPEWIKTATTHAKKYTCCETFVIETETHEWNNGTCSECGYVCLHTADTNKDHKCDACGSTVGTHEAALGKHTCDYCEKTVTECIDSNKDHKCDICGAAMGTHEAASGKHTCDYCGKTASECADANDDGKCDICGANYGACVDSNKDHLCDKHGETMGTHEAALGKHTCDYCNKPVTECSDDNKDHKCDTCGEAMGTHVAASGKHTCDYCNKVVTECADGNKDHKCDTCSTAMGTHEAATGKHTCDYCGKTVTECADSDKNHKCDTCSSNMGTHEAASGKHTCDYCTEVVTQCVDSNKDHKCDICGAAMGTHEAATGKHTCDYCGKTVTECADTNSDGKCDTCGANYGECVDSNKDHKCDKHGEAMGTHEAALGKHTCDYCGQTVTECEDANKDHKCDTCETAVGTHQAATGKHTCDYCGKTVTECADSNKDHKCDTCSTAMGTHEAADGKHTCDYCGKTVTDCTDSNKDHKCDTCSTAMGTHEAANGKHTCDYCGVAITECVDTNKDHKCDTCGASVGVHNAATGKHTCDYCGKTVTECTDSSEDDDSKCDICGKNIGDCVDENKDHKCDKHDENMGVHEAALGKHTCDYCGKTVTECADANKDHKCDTCETTVGTHEAATGKHTCDYCGKTVTECADSNKDHKCDTCSTAMGTHEAANGKHSCDYCGKDVTECSDGNTDGKCDVCQKDLGTVHTHDYGTTWKTDANNHWKECACGEKSELAAHVDNNGDNKCDTCDYAMPAHNPDTPDNPDNPNNTPDNPDNTPDDPSDDKDGLGAGAIVGIVIGSVAVAGVGGFALFWFVIKKKSFADLIAVFKK